MHPAEVLAIGGDFVILWGLFSKPFTAKEQKTAFEMVHRSVSDIISRRSGMFDSDFRFIFNSLRQILSSTSPQFLSCRLLANGEMIVGAVHSR